MNAFLKLKSIFPENYINLIENEYNELIKAYNLEDEVKSGIHSGRICELFSALLCNFELKQIQDLNKINFDKNCNILINIPNKSPQQEITSLMIPLVLKSIYSIRSKKIAHFKLNLPKKVDMKYIKIAIDWVLAQFCIIFLNINEIDIREFLEKVTSDEFKRVEKFEDGDFLIYLDKVSLTDKILFILYDHYNQGRITKEELNRRLKPKKKSYLSIYLGNLKNKNLIHVNYDGVILTKIGLDKCKKLILKLKE